MKTSLFSIGYPTSFITLIDRVKSFGFDGIELFNSNELAIPDLDAAKRIGDHAKRQDIVVSCISVGADLSKADNSDEIARLKQYVLVAQAAESSLIHFTLFPRLKHDIERVPFYQILDRIILAVRELCAYAAERSVKCVCENQGFFMNGWDAFERLLTGVNHPNFGLVADLGNILYVNETPESFVGRFAPHICHTHIKDYFSKSGAGPNPGTGWKMTRSGDFLQNAEIGRGIINFEKIFRILIAAGYGGYYSIEHNLNNNEEIIQLELANMRLFYENAIRMIKPEAAAELPITHR